MQTVNITPADLHFHWKIKERTYGGNSRQRRIAKRRLKRSIAYTELVRDVYAHMLKLNEDQIKSLIYGEWTTEKQSTEPGNGILSATTRIQPVWNLKMC